MQRLQRLMLVTGFVLALAAGGVALGQGVARQYYSSWTYYPERTYYYRAYYYKPYVEYPNYTYHYVITYPSQPRYYYYYNPQRRVYWGRYDTEAKGYSLLDEKDRKAKIEDIPEEAFPKPAQMPLIPESKDNVRMEAPPNDAPKEAPKK